MHYSHSPSPVPWVWGFGDLGIGDSRSRACQYLQATGTLCDLGAGFCHSGRCGSLGGQCRLLWGQQAAAAHSTCFSLNERGDARGNCGYKDNNRTHFISCSKEDIRCGLLHCHVRKKTMLFIMFEFVIILRSEIMQMIGWSWV